MQEPKKTKKGRPKKKKEGELTSSDWDSLQQEMEKADSGAIKVVDLTDPENEAEEAKLDGAYSFSVFYKSPKEHKHYKGTLLYGTFTAHIATFEDHMKMGKVRAECRGGLLPESCDEEFSLMIEQKAAFSVLLDSYPEWFDLDHLYDRMLALNVYQEVVQREATFCGGVL